MTVVDLGMMVVSSSYSRGILVNSFCYMMAYKLTFAVIIGIDVQVKVGTIAEATLGDNLTLQLKDRDTGTIKLDSSGLLLRLELEKDGRCHFG
jgi:hypothetical protein